MTTRNITPVYHVGDLDEDWEKPHISYEGRGLSVSLHPEDWSTIMGQNGKIHELSKDDAEFYVVDPQDTLEEEKAWCIEESYIQPTDAFRVSWSEDGETCYLECYSKSKARAEAESRQVANIERVDSIKLDVEGIKYWNESFEQAPESADPLTVEGLIPVWYAKDRGFDGVWWDEEHNLSKLSAPRGVIYQEQLDTWEIQQTGRTY